MHVKCKWAVAWSEETRINRKFSYSRPLIPSKSLKFNGLNLKKKPIVVPGEEGLKLTPVLANIFM